MIGRNWPVPFSLDRTHDVSGKSGTGMVASGVIWPDGRAAMRWTGNTPPAGYAHCVRQINLFDNVEEITGVHNHNGSTVLSRRDPAAPCVGLGLVVFGIVAWYGARSRITHWGARWDRGPALTWRCDPDRPVRIEAWPDGAAAAFNELGDLDADEARLVWVPSDALMIASVGRSTEGRRWLRGSAPGYTPATKSPRPR